MVTADEVDAANPEFAAALADACRGGQTGLTWLFREHHPRLLRYLRSREPRAADDIAGETWIAVARGIRRFEGGPSDFMAWLFTIARQRLADHGRTGARRKTDPVDELPERAGASSEDLALNALGAQGAVDLIVQALTPDQADVVLLTVLGGLSTSAVAAAMQRSEVWVRVNHHRALRKLRDRLSSDTL